MTNVGLIIDDNIRYLRQADQLLDSLSDFVYARNFPPLYKSGVGSHLRHCLDHYASFLHGLPKGRIDYDGRDRDERIEVDRDYARARLMDIVTRMQRLDHHRLDETVDSKTDCGSDDPCTWSRSSIRRELQFLVSHTVHHFALIALILRHQGIEPPHSFGVAPSTLRHEESKKPCAP